MAPCQGKVSVTRLRGTVKARRPPCPRPRCSASFPPAVPPAQVPSALGAATRASPCSGQAGSPSGAGVGTARQPVLFPPAAASVLTRSPALLTPSRPVSSVSRGFPGCRAQDSRGLGGIRTGWGLERQFHLSCETGAGGALLRGCGVKAGGRVARAPAAHTGASVLAPTQPEGSRGRRRREDLVCPNLPA